MGFDEIQTLTVRLRGILKKRGPMVTVVDLSELNLTQFTALHRKRLAEEAEKLAGEGAFLGGAVIIRNPVLHALFVAYQWARGTNTPFPSKAFSDTASAVAWAEAQAQVAAGSAKAAIDKIARRASSGPTG
jgi:hypothetical protein